MQKVTEVKPFHFCFSYNDECDGYYYYNTKTKARQWEHPLDAEYKRLVEKARKSSGTGVNDLSDVICILLPLNFLLLKIGR